jgi:RNA polymerase primary sigma factor
MKQKYEGKEQSLVELGREQGYLTFDQVNDFLPQDVSSPADLRSALERFQDMEIKVLADVPADGTEGELEAEVKEGPDETAEPAPAADSIGESSDPVRLYLKEMGNFQLLSREQEVEIAKRIEAGEFEVEDEVLRSPVTLDFLIEVGDHIEAGETDLRESGIFEQNEESSNDPDEERGPEADEKQLKKLFTAVKKLKSLRAKVDETEDKIKEKPKGPNRSKLDKQFLKLKDNIKEDLAALDLSRHVHEAVIGEMRRLLKEARESQTLIQRYEEATGRSKSQLLREAAEAEDRRHVLKINGNRESLLDIAARIKAAQKTIREVERRVKVATDEFARSVETIASGQAKSRRAKQELTEGMCCNFGGVGW